jgi:hypothetical protein
MKFWLPFVFAILVVGSILSPLTAGSHQENTWIEVCKGTKSFSWYVNRKYISKGQYAKPNPNPEPLANIWVKVIPRQDTESGRKEYQDLLAIINKHVKDKADGFSYQMLSYSFRCSSRLSRIDHTVFYDANGKQLYDEKPASLAEIVREDDVIPGTIADCIMDIGCKEIAEREKQQP